MMIIYDGKLTVLDGKIDFRSAFRSLNPKTQMAAHKRLVEALTERGYYPNGKPPWDPRMPELDPSDLLLSWASLAVSIDQLSAEMKTQLDQVRAPVVFWGNPETGQRIPVKDMFAATDLWPLEEVLELVA